MNRPEPAKPLMTGSKDEISAHKRRSKSEAASQQAATRKRNFLKLLSIKRSKDTPLRPKPNLRFPKLAWRDEGTFGDPSDTYPPLGRLEPSLAAGAKEWPICYLGSIPNCSDWRAYKSRSEFMQHVDWAKRHGYVMWRSLSQKLLLLSSNWLQVTDKRKKLLYVLNGTAQISSISSCEDRIDEDLVLGIKCLHPLGSMVQCHVLIVQSRKAMAEICLELEGSFESLARDREQMAQQIHNVSESLARIQHQGGKAFTVHHLADGALEGVELESRHAKSEQPPLRDSHVLSTALEDSRIVSIASSTAAGSLHPPLQSKQFEIHQLDPAQTGAQIPKRLQTLVQSQPFGEEAEPAYPEPDSDSDKVSLEPIPSSLSIPPDPTEAPPPDKPVARRIQNLISRLDLSEENPASPQEAKLQPPPPKKIWQDGQEDDPVLPPDRKPRRRQLDDPPQERPDRHPRKEEKPSHRQEFHQTENEIKEMQPPPLIAQAPKSPKPPQSPSRMLAETERELLNQQLELDMALEELQALNLGVDLPITHVDVPTIHSNPTTSVDKRHRKTNKKEFSGLRTVIPAPPPDIPPELLDTGESEGEFDIETGTMATEEVEVPEQVSARELRRKFDPHPDRKTALLYEIKQGRNLRKVSGDHPDQHPKQSVDFRSVLTEIKQGGSRQRLRKVSQASLNRLAQSQKGRAVGELGAKLAERRLATEPPEKVPVDPAVYKAQMERHASRFARSNTVVNPQTDLDAEPEEYLPPWKRQLLESRERKRVAAIWEKEERERLREEQMKDVPIWKRKLIEKKTAEREVETKKEVKERARMDSRIRKFENLPEWKKELLRKQGKVDVIETSDSDTESD